MRISDSSILMTSQATSRETYHETERLEIQQNTIPESSSMPTFKLYDQFALPKSNLLESQKNDQVSEYEEYDLNISEADKEKIRLLEKLLESLTGKKIKFRLPTKFKGKKINHEKGLATLKKDSDGKQDPLIRYERKTHYTETSSMAFASTGTIKTEDGRTINFNLNISMNRKFEATTHESIQIGGKMEDPLVINFNSPSAKLTERKFDFDLTSNGELENISFVQSGSGFLAIDKNEDGIINNGSEVFGPTSGNGFLELAQYDDDGNGWIDESDKVFDDLLIWTKDQEGKDELFGLIKKDVGAIYLGNVSSKYGLKTSGNQLLGQIQSTGVYAKESGSVGTIQHVDLVV